MFGFPVRTFLKDPLQYWMDVQDFHAAKQEDTRPKFRYQPINNWEQQLHESLGAPWPCSVIPEFWALWPKVNKELELKGIDPGPASFQWWNDGDAALVRAIWCLVRHTRPKKVVETGVAHGVSSRFILEALEANGEGQLWSIDLKPTDKFWHSQVGAAVGKRSDRWSYIEGSSRRRLPKLLSQLGEIDLFVHDSLHTERNVRFELDLAWVALRPKGALVADDVDVNWGFHSFNQACTGQCSMIGEAEPLRPDLLRPRKKGMFGIILKQQISAALPTAEPLR